jgi:hypothetical protein
MTLVHRKRKYARFIRNLQSNCPLLKENGVSVSVWVKSDYKLAVLCYTTCVPISGSNRKSIVKAFSPFEIEPGYIDSITPATLKCADGYVDDDLGPILSPLGVGPKRK